MLVSVCLFLFPSLEAESQKFTLFRMVVSFAFPSHKITDFVSETFWMI
jgi:hypothetical protein